MRIGKIMLLVVFTMLFFSSVGFADGDYKFILNGKKIDPYIISLNGEPEKPKPGDLVSINRCLITLGEPGEYKFKGSLYNGGKLFLVKKDGFKQVIAVKIRWDYNKKGKIIHNPLDKLSKKEIEGLRAICFDAWPQGVEEQLKFINPKRVCITLKGEVAQGKSMKFPPLPENIAYLSIDENSNQGIKDYAPLSNFKSLVFLSVNVFTNDHFDILMVSNNNGLRSLNLNGQNLINSDKLPKFKQLRWLNIGDCDGIKDLQFAADMKFLKYLIMYATKIPDLSPLASLKFLTYINANSSAIKKLPTRGFPSLKALKIMSSKLSKKDVEAFAKAHPDCKISFGWNTALQNSLVGVTKIRLRSGGTCHRDRDREKIFFEEKNIDKIKKIIANIKVDEENVGFHCMCCGNPTFEFYKGEKLVAMLGFHHGKSVRWAGGDWPNDAGLTEDSLEFICKWLSDNGIKGPLNEREDAKRRQIAYKRKQERIVRILPRVILEKLKNVDSRSQFLKVFEDELKDETERAIIFFKIIGCSESRWNNYGNLEMLLLEEILPKMDTSTIAKAIKIAVKDQTGLKGAARWLFGERNWTTYYKQLKPESILLVAMNGLANPIKANRLATMKVLSETKSEFALNLLGKVLDGKIKVGQLSEEDKSSPEGMAVARPGDVRAVETVSDQAYAALFLAEIGDKKSLEKIKKLAVKAEGKNREMLEKAINLLNN